MEVDPDYSEVFSVQSRAGSAAGEDVVRAQSVLDAAGIPCHLDFCEDPPEDADSATTHQWRVLVPGKLNMRATNILDRDIFNDEFEALWRTYLEILSDEELNEADPQEVLCGHFDRIERALRVYSDELSRRGLPSQ
jgi:hypothetical protein